MNKLSPHHYDDSKLTGLNIAELIAREWAGGNYASIAAVTSAVHAQRPNLPRSAVFWLAYHTLTRGTGAGVGGVRNNQTWPVR